MRAIVTSAVKYTENKLRACLGVKSRLAIRDLPDEYKRIIDKYFEAEFARLKKERDKANQPEYERLYDAPEEKVSFADAIEIERASWKMTARLVEGTEAEEESTISYAEQDTAYGKAVSLPEELENSTEALENNDTYGLSDLEIGYLQAAAEENNEKMQAMAREIGMPEDAVAEKINEAFADNFGDVIIEDDGMGNFTIIEDYYEEIIEWLQ
jgi:uncharacterized coiled-coil DUF342 family protein